MAGSQRGSIIWPGCTFTRSGFVIAQDKLYAMETKQHHTQATSTRSFSRPVDAILYIDIEYSIVKVINNEMTHKYSWKCSNWFDSGFLTVGVAWLTNLTLLWIVFKIKKILLLLYWNWTLKMWKKFFGISMLIDLSENAAAILKSIYVK